MQRLQKNIKNSKQIAKNMVDEEEDTTQICTKNRELKRNPQLSLCIRFFFCVCATLWVGSFFLFFIILYIIYKYIYIYNNIYIQYIDILVHEQIQSKKHKPMKVAGCVLGQNPVHSIL